MNEQQMFNGNRRWRKLRFFIPFFAIGALLLIGGSVMYLWNAILPELLGVKIITFWQALGLLVLCRILFGSFRMGGPGGGGRFRGRSQAMQEKWMNMNDEEREQFKAEWKRRCAQRSDDHN